MSKEQVKKAILAGNVEFTPRVQAAIENMSLKNPDFTIENVAVSFWGPNKFNGGGMGIDWSTKSAGCGRCDLYIKDGKLCCMNEAMGKKFIATLLDYILEQVELE